MKRWSRWALGLSLALHLILSGWGAWHETPTVDEYAHVPAGLAYWDQGAWSLYSKSPPLLRLWMSAPAYFFLHVNIPTAAGISPFAWGPWIYGLGFEQANSWENYSAAFLWSRVMVLLLSVSTGFLLFVWVRELCPGEEWPPVVATAGFWLAPTVLAHGHLATTDMGSAFFILLSVVLLQRCSLAAGLALGAAIASKFTAAVLLPYFVYRLWRAGWRWLLLGLASAWLTVCACYGFHAVGGYDPSLFHSHLPRVAHVPLPADLIYGLDAQISDAENGEFSYYLMGEVARQGWWDYNLLALLLKETSLTVLLLLLLPFGWRQLSRRWAAPFAWLALPLFFFNPIQVGVRYLLPLFPFLFAGIAQVWRRWSLGTVALWAALALVAAPRGFLTYFNPVALAFHEPAYWLLDSNLDWGQDLYRLREFAQTHSPLGLVYFGHVDPKHYVASIDTNPRPAFKGWLVVSPNFSHGLSYVTPSEGGFRPVDGTSWTWLKDQAVSFHLGALEVYQRQ
jgi:hypothetical protein